MPRITLEVSEELSQQLAQGKRSLTGTTGFKSATTSNPRRNLSIHSRLSGQQSHTRTNCTISTDTTNARAIAYFSNTF
ncbi:MAG: hypothetical protein RMY28_029560 [Nostoc sp. ChiSLP01]|nr:hypothetical protein [Nostoc sp. CmiSLP01]MDZ8282951.1 hypothetical protein [Nostoc sp. ChiSLP01]